MKNSPVEVSSWANFQSAFKDLIEEMLGNRLELEGQGKAAAAGAPAAPGASVEEMKRLVLDAVSGVLVEGHLIEKIAAKSIRHQCEEIFKTLVDQELIQSLQKEIRQVVQVKLIEFGNSESFKSIIDGRFRMMENYFRTDVIPKVLEKLLNKHPS